MFIRSKVFAVLALAASLILPSHMAFASDDLQNKVKLQEALSTFLDGRSTDGQITLLDQDDKKLKAVYLSSNHPMIVPLNNGNYFLCADGYDEEGNQVQMDFLVSPKGEGFMVIDAMLNARPSVKQVVESQ